MTTINVYHSETENDGFKMDEKFKHVLRLIFEGVQKIVLNLTVLIAKQYAVEHHFIPDISKI